MPNDTGQVVVITGGSSGIGRVTAHAFAREGASVVLAARRTTMLEAAAEECRVLGGLALAVPTDVTDEEQVQHLADRAIEAFGRIDVWFNNAGVGVFGRFDQIPSDVWRQVLEVNVLGTANGARAAMRHFVPRGRGVLINNSSVVGRTAKPDSSAYATAKFAVRGLGEALRQEALIYSPNIHVCTILPSVIDTPFFHHAANYSGRRLRAAPPVYPPEKVALAVVGLAKRPRAEVAIGGASKVASVMQRLAPPLIRRVNAPALHRGFLAPQPSPISEGTVFEPNEDGRAVSGGWRKGSNNGGVPSVALGAAAMTLAGLLWWSRRARSN